MNEVFSNIESKTVFSSICPFEIVPEETFFRLTEDGHTRILEDEDIRILE